MADRDQSPQDVAALRAELERLGGELRVAEERAEQAERFATLGRLLAGVVHELNNPLTAVTMYSAALPARSPDPGERAVVDAIQEAADRIQRLSRELLGFVRPGTSPSALDLGELADEALRLARPDLKASGAALERQPGGAPVQGSRQSLVQVVVALVSNAAQATGPGGHVRVTVRQEEGEARLTVADDGAGMSDEVRARAFDPFFTTRPGEALGLGLSTARAIVERHRGRITLESAPGRGTTVTIALPAG